MTSRPSPAPVWPALFGLLALSSGAPPALAQPVPVPASAKPASAVERLSHLARLWGAVRYFHPWLAYQEIDWDAALVQAIPRVRAARTAEQYAAAVQTMLGALGDPVTRVRPVPTGDPEASLPPDDRATLVQWVEPGVLALYCRPNAAKSWEEMVRKLAAARPEIPKAKAVIVDVRGAGGWPFHPQYILAEVEGLLVGRPATAPVQRHLLHSGYRSQLAGTSGSYSSGFLTLFPESFSPSPQPAPQRIVFLVSPETAVPPLAAALQATGQGAIVAEGKIGEDGLVRQRTVALGEGFAALVRTTEIVPAPGWPGLHADLEVAPGKPGEADAAFAAALKLARDGWPAPAPAAAAPLPEPAGRLDRPYTEMTDPSPEYRLLAVCRLWNVFHYFHPYIGLAGDWDAVLPEFIARMIEVRDGRKYALTMAEMAARTGDGHTSLTGNPTLDQLSGEAPLPLLIRWIEGAWVVTAVSDDPAIRNSGGEPEPGEEDEVEATGKAGAGEFAAVGDVVLSLDGEPVTVREELLRRHLAASTEAGLRRKVADRLLSGVQGSQAALTVRGRDGRVKTVRLRRGPWTPKPAGETVRVLPGDLGDLGYVDLGRLTVDEVDAMFERLKGTRGIVFDMRGYPNGTASLIASRLNVRGAPFGALFRRPLVSGLGGDDEPTSVSFAQPLPATEAPKYTGKTVLLIDERTVSQSEHLGLFFEVANGTKFVGTPTAGANGDVTWFTLPGIAAVRFSGHEVRHADGRQLQRIGLVPDLLAAPTLQGIRDGRDEVLERGIELLNRELAAAGSPADRAGASGTGAGTSSD
ncbi:MAG: hypothetical protein DMF53_28060 [Acidobacteria bacterium]|nr:MAG: hypothetical protein DMF53_28060 [Acidobacteriota bacterium]